VKKVLDVTRKKSEKPFFVFYGMSAGHHPFNCCKEHEDNPIADREKRYGRALGFIDDRLEELVSGLAEDGTLANTLVLIFSDHGDVHGDRAGRNAWQPVVHVPWVMLGPQLGNRAGRSSMVASLMDISPTVLGLLGIEIPRTMKGRNFRTDTEHRIALFGGRPPKWQLGVADENWKFIWEDKSVEMLFDIPNDPGEKTNLAEAHPDRVDFYKNKVNEWSAFSTNLIENYAEILSKQAPDSPDPNQRANSPAGGVTK
jgi:arylsulfatase A-like enzyme